MRAGIAKAIWLKTRRALPSAGGVATLGAVAIGGLISISRSDWFGPRDFYELALVEDGVTIQAVDDCGVSRRPRVTRARGKLLQLLTFPSRDNSQPFAGHRSPLYAGDWT